jgi:hypothetical protein
LFRSPVSLAIAKAALEVGRLHHSGFGKNLEGFGIWCVCKVGTLFERQAHALLHYANHSRHPECCGRDETIYEKSKTWATHLPLEMLNIKPGELGIRGQALEYDQHHLNAAAYR